MALAGFRGTIGIGRRHSRSRLTIDEIINSPAATVWSGWRFRRRLLARV